MAAVRATSTKPLERPKIRADVEAWILEGVTDAEIARRVGVHRSAVGYFRKRHAAELAPLIAGVNQQIRDVAIRDKEERIRRYWAMIQQIDALVEQRGGLEAVDAKWVGTARSGREVEVRRFDAALVGKWHELHREVAEELAQIPRQSDSNVTVNVAVAVQLAWSDGSDAT